MPCALTNAPLHSLSTTFAQSAPGKPINAAGWDYSRSGNPTRDGFEAAAASAECGGMQGIAFASGLAATDVVVRSLPKGSRLVCCDDVYGGTRRLLSQVLELAGTVNVIFVDFGDAAALGSALTGDVAAVWIESPSNPTLKVVDIAAVAAAARAANPEVLVVVDNTFLSPAGQSPIQLGADLVLHSVTKLIAGHSDVVGGIVITSCTPVAVALYPRLRFLQKAVGAVPSPFDCFLAHRGLKTLPLRLAAAAANAAAVAAALEASSKVERVAYPGLASHPQHAQASRQASSFGAMVTVRPAKH